LATLTTTGIETIIDLIAASATKPQYVDWGTSTAAESAGHTALTAKCTELRIQGTETQPSADTLRYVATFTAETSKAIGEAGTFTSSGSSGTMYIRGVHAPVALTSGDQIEYTINLQQT